MTVAGAEDSNHIFLTYYAGEEDRQDWQAQFGDPLPPHKTKPSDRDQFLPTVERRLAALAEQNG
jgi:hypothetical protein